MTQKELADRLNISFQAVSKWETGEGLPDIGILLELCDALNTTADLLLHGGTLTARGRGMLRVRDVIDGFGHMESVGKCFGEDSTFYTGMIEGINRKMNMDLLPALKDPATREVLYAEVLIQGILAGRTVSMEEVEGAFTNKKMVEVIRRYHQKGNAE